jgi:hypothetical protein
MKIPVLLADYPAGFVSLVFIVVFPGLVGLVFWVSGRRKVAGAIFAACIILYVIARRLDWS